MKNSLKILKMIFMYMKFWPQNLKVHKLLNIKLYSKKANIIRLTTLVDKNYNNDNPFIEKVFQHRLK